MNKDYKKQQQRQKIKSTSRAKSVFVVSLTVLAGSQVPGAQGYVAFSRANKSLLSYRNIDMDMVDDQSDQQQQSMSQQQIPQYHVSNVFYTWWTASKSQRAKRDAEAYAVLLEKEEQQVILDKYLESIDRRYKRIHQRERQNLSDGVGNAWQWLMSGQKTESSVSIEERRKEDAIYVLGLANLASKSLLEKHQLPIPKSKIQTQSLQTAAIDIKSTSFSNNSIADTTFNFETFIGKRLFSMPAFLKSRIRNSKIIFPCYFAPVLEIATSFSGGKQNLQLASFFLAALLASIASIIRPFLRIHLK